MHKILVSACLLGRPVRYDGRAKTLSHQLISHWSAQGRLVPVCPEVAGGLSTPRPPAEITSDGDGLAVLAGEAEVMDNRGQEVTAQFLRGAEIALALARGHDCRYALLTDGSPSCGSSFIYSGQFNGVTRDGAGVVTAMLRKNGIEVFSQDQIETLAYRIQRREQG